MLFVPLQDLDGELCGGWPRSELERMDTAFTAAVKAAFAAGLESPAAAAVRIGSVRNGKAIEGAIGAAWDLLCRKRGEVAASEIVAFVRARCPGVDVLRIRFGIEQRLRRHGATWG